MKFFVSTGEVSGDLHLSYLVKSIKEKYDDVKFFGVAGNHSKKAGVEIIQDIDELAIMGFVEVIKKYKFLKNKAYEYLEFIKNNKINKVILVDYGGFNLKFLELLKKELPSIEVFYYIPPKVWIWGEKRVEKIRLADHIMVIFPWEVDFYKKHRINAIYFGNPFVDKYIYLDRTNENILLLPGSRKQEIKSLMPIYIDLIKKYKNEQFILKLSSNKHLSWVKEIVNLDYSNLKIEIKKDIKECVKISKYAIAASGTVTLELALLGLPTIVVYKTNFINAFIAKYILKLGFVSLPNLTMNKEVFPELLQEKCNLDCIEKEIYNFEKNIDEINLKVLEVRNKLSGDNIIDNYARFLVEN